MKINSFIDPAKRLKFRNVLDMTLEEYVVWFRKTRPGNKPFKDLYNNVVEHLKLPNVDDDIEDLPPLKDPLVEKLNGIPLEEIRFYVRNAKYNTIQNFMPTLGALFTFEPNLNDDKRPRWQTEAINYQKVLKEKCESIIDNYYNFEKIRTLPAVVDKKLSFTENYRKAIDEFLIYLDQRKDCTKFDNRFYKGLRLNSLQSIYRNNKTINEVAAETSNPHSANVLITNYVNELHQDLMDGNTLCSNLRINDDLKQWIMSIKEQCVFKSKSFLETIAGKIKDDDSLEPLNLILVSVVGDIKFVIPKEKKGVYSDISACIIDELRNTIAPDTKEAIFNRILASDKFQKIYGDFDAEFIHNVLSCPEIVDIMDDGTIIIKETLLQSNEQRAARIMYKLCQKYGKVTKQQLSDAYQEKYNVPYKNISTIKRFGFNPVQERGTIWHYGDSLKSLIDAVKDYIEEHKIFYFNDITTFLKDKGYVITNSLRVYITNLCNVDTKDNQHFCHKECCDDYPQFSWRSQSRSGLCNWVLNQVSNRLDEDNEVPFKEMLNYIERNAHDTIFERDIKIRATLAIKLYCGDDKPFMLDGDIIKKNVGIFENTDFDTIGLRGEKYASYKSIRDIITNEINSSEDGRLLLTYAIKIVNDIIEEPQERYTIIRAIENKHLPDIGLEISSIGGKVYIVKSSGLVATHDESINEKIVSLDKQNDIKITEIQTTKTRTPVTYSLAIDWELFNNDLLNELSGYASMMEYEKIDLNKAISVFFNFIRNSKNANLSSKLPHNLYEFCRARNNRFDLDTYVSNLAIFYEGLLCDILNRKQKLQPNSSFREIALKFPDLAHALKAPHPEGFEKIFDDLYNKRNMIVHGYSLDLNTAETAKCILDFTALYIFTVAKYATKS